jgi:hypothetical protein
MFPISKRLNGLLATATALLAVPAAAQDTPLPELGLMGTIPLYWGEADDIAGLLGNAEPHWARGQLERAYRLRPLDTLAADQLAGLGFLLLAQPRALSAEENVALDAWVRAGGHLLLFADPMLTGYTRFAIGDRRRPQDVILLSPLLRHWGLELEFDDSIPAEPELVEGGGAAIPVNLPGRFAPTETCRLDAASILARCALGMGNVLVLADAALLDLHSPHASASAGLDWLTREVFGDSREIAGKSAARTMVHRAE